jgi:hypothetical protein
MSSTRMLARPDRRTAHPTTDTPSSAEQKAMGPNTCIVKKGVSWQPLSAKQQKQHPGWSVTSDSLAQLAHLPQYGGQDIRSEHMSTWLMTVRRVHQEDAHLDSRDSPLRS